MMNLEKKKKKKSSLTKNTIVTTISKEATTKAATTAAGSNRRNDLINLKGPKGLLGPQRDQKRPKGTFRASQRHK